MANELAQIDLGIQTIGQKAKRNNLSAADFNPLRLAVESLSKKVTAMEFDSVSFSSYVRNLCRAFRQVRQWPNNNPLLTIPLTQINELLAFGENILKQPPVASARYTELKVDDPHRLRFVELLGNVAQSLTQSSAAQASKQPAHV